MCRRPLGSSRENLRRRNCAVQENPTCTISLLTYRLEMTAHLTFAGGGMLLPASTPYERQVLREYALNLIRSKQNVRIEVDRKTWLLECLSGERSALCRRCKQELKVAALHRAGHKGRYCAACALP